MTKHINQSISPGSLYVVATPIGNLDDLSGRAVAVLKSVAVIAAEDTRRTKTLLNHYGIKARRLVSLHEHNESQRVPALIETIENGGDVAVVTDTGTPLISDPGYRLVTAAGERLINVVSVPGPSAVTAALSISGLATDRFSFEGFLPSRRAARRTTLEHLKSETRTLVFFESARRISECVSDCSDIFGGQREAALCREMTKRFESVMRGPLEEISQRLSEASEEVKGEIVLVVSGSSQPVDRPQINETLLLRLLANALPPRQASEIAAQVTGGRKNDLYQRLLDLEDPEAKS